MKRLLTAFLGATVLSGAVIQDAQAFPVPRGTSCYDGKVGAVIYDKEFLVPAKYCYDGPRDYVASIVVDFRNHTKYSTAVTQTYDVNDADYDRVFWEFSSGVVEVEID